LLIDKQIAEARKWGTGGKQDCMPDVMPVEKVLACEQLWQKKVDYKADWVVTGSRPGCE